MQIIPTKIPQIPLTTNESNGDLVSSKGPVHPRQSSNLFERSRLRYAFGEHLVLLSNSAHLDVRFEGRGFYHGL